MQVGSSADIVFYAQCLITLSPDKWYLLNEKLIGEFAALNNRVKFLINLWVIVNNSLYLI